MSRDQLTLEDAPRRRTEPEPLRPIGLPIASTDPAKLTAASYLGVSRATMYRLRAAGEVEGFHVGAAAMITRESLDAYMERQRARDLEELRA